MLESPLVSVSLVAFNHEKYIRAAIRSVLAQSYQPLEVIISDDCSSDSTFSVIKEEASRYKGPHRLVVHRNDVNLGIIENYNRTWSRCSGDIVAVQCGDDIAKPERMSKIVAAMRVHQVDYICSDVQGIDEDGNDADKALRSWIGWPKDFSLETFVNSGAVGGFLGCSAAFRKSLFTKYGPMRSDVLAEDCVMPFRAALEGGIKFLEERLVEYRIHPAMFSARDLDSAARDDRLYVAKARLANIEEWRRCLSLSDKETDEIRERLDVSRLLRQLDVNCFEASALKSVALTLNFIRRGAPARHALGLLRRHLREKWLTKT